MRTKQQRKQFEPWFRITIQYNKHLVRVMASYMPIISHKLIIGLWPRADPPELDYTIYISNAAIRLLITALLIYN